MKPRLKLVVAIGVVLLSLLLSLSVFLLPAPQPATAAEDGFSAERAMAHVRQLAAKPHPVATA